MTSILRTAASAACLTVVVTLSAHAQTTPAPVINVDVPPMECTNPGNAPLDRASPAMGRFSKKVEEYKVCVNQYTALTGGKANEYANASKAYSEAANKAIDDYNTYVINLNEATRSDKTGTSKNTK